MLFSTTSIATLGLFAATGLAAPTTLHSRATGGQNVVYWGQNGGGTIENNDLSAYCSSTAGIDILVLAFLYEYGNGNEIASGGIGQSCSIATSGEGSQCDALASAISTCQSKGIKVILSLGGAVGAYSLSSQQEAETIGQNLWEAYGNVQGGSVPRPFGSTFVNGFDFDIESNSGNQYYQYMIAKLRSNFASDSANTYYITGAPQCPLPEPNMGEIISASQFDYLWVQFYNNPGCSTNGNINYNDWLSFLATTPSKNAKLFIGVPASPDGATGTASGAQYYLAPSALSTLVSQFSSNSAFGGVMMWSAGFSDANMNGGCTYAQSVKSILSGGGSCGSIAGGSGSGGSGSTPASSSSAAAAPTTTAAASPTSTAPAATSTTEAAAPTTAAPTTTQAAAPTTMATVTSAAAATTDDGEGSFPTVAPNKGSTGGGSVSGVQTGSCSSEGEWNCIGGSQWQRCSSGQWSVVMPVADGTTCVTGMSANLELAAR